jgi:hypothetical protein
MPLNQQALSKIVGVYQKEIDGLISSFGKNVTLYYKPTTSNIQSDFDDFRPDEIRKPDFKAETTEEIPVVTQETDVIKALLEYNPKDFQNLDLNIKTPNSILALKTYLSYVPKLKRCQYIIPNSDSKDIAGGKFTLIREPIPIGLQIDRYSISYWQRI